MLKAERKLEEHDAALRGDLDGKLGLFAMMEQLCHRQKDNAEKLGRAVEQLDGLRLDKQKVLGLILGISAVWGVIYKLFLK